MTTILRTSSLAALLAACPGPTDDTTTGDTGTGPFAAYAEADLTNPEVVRDLANNASAPNAYAVTVVLFGLLQVKEGDCPSSVIEGDVTTWTGGCTDDDGNVWEGTATFAGTETAGTVAYQAFGRTSEVTCASDGTVSQRSVFMGELTVDESQAYTIAVGGEGTDADADACTATPFTFRMEYDGQVVDSGPYQETWSGSGRYGDTLRGKVSATTVDEVLDDDGVCGTEALSGTTTMVADDDTVVITYDGATDCDAESTVTWTLNGDDQGELTGVSCATLPGAAGLGWLAGVGLLALRRRRALGHQPCGAPRRA